MLKTSICIKANIKKIPQVQFPNNPSTDPTSLNSLCLLHWRIQGWTCGTPPLLTLWVSSHCAQLRQLIADVCIYQWPNGASLFI